MDSVKSSDGLGGDHASAPLSKFQQLVQQRTEQVLAERRAQEAHRAEMERARLNYKPQQSQRFQQMLKDRIQKALAERRVQPSFRLPISTESDYRGDSERVASSSPLSLENGTLEEKSSTINAVEGHSISPEIVATSVTEAILPTRGHKEPEESNQGPQSPQTQQDKPSTILLQQQTSNQQRARVPHIQPRSATDPRELEQLPSPHQKTLGTKKRMDSLTTVAIYQHSNGDSNGAIMQLAVPETQEAQCTKATPEAQETLEAPTKRIKKSTSPKNNPACTCSISTKCEVAAANGVKDCRAIARGVIQKSISRSKSARSNSEILEILSLIKKIEARTDLERTIPRLRDRIHFLELYEIPESSIESMKAKFLDPNNGLPAIIRNHNSIPWDIRLDCSAILKRMEEGNFHVDLSRGILTKRTFRENGKSSVSRVLDKNYPFKQSAFVVGDRHLRNGQWFPWQICALRDGAHGEIEGGISGNKVTGAVSIVLSSSGGGGNQMYADVDQGDTVWYCGTRGKNGEVSANTALLLQAAGRKSDIRVLRSSKLPKVNPYRPSEGMRYDGLYKICSYEILDQETALHRFKLERVEGQTPIRYKGPEVRPTAREVEELRKAYRHNAESKPAKEPKMKQPAAAPPVVEQKA
ncbi:uncharacterized protein ARB_06151 [Trichophyton benhamiae CBS 112371]|uniref:YDG domain-containing protein n=1 Tax=Arthroderma benhamiae (strain ATCC MYA-4681 / CBS 112371) TaxID=663331 RepID=D4API3_ARTBC|nr:uncharacterized protein ARB_06151 [Trichophyton benhamiae CBS 112371]EFE35194.1 hypothetical protein ARB_06151 [Trichophyton benhamiae CBS 112371]